MKESLTIKEIDKLKAEYRRLLNQDLDSSDMKEFASQQKRIEELSSEIKEMYKKIGRIV